MIPTATPEIIERIHKENCDAAREGKPFPWIIGFDYAYGEGMFIICKNLLDYPAQIDQEPTMYEYRYKISDDRLLSLPQEGKIQ